jgi:plastocyanin
LPDALLGDGWVLLDEAAHAEPDHAVFVGGDVTTWGGPAGARVRIFRFEVAGSMSAVRRSWQVVGHEFESHRNAIDTDDDVGREEELAALPLPEGCADGRRVDGADGKSGAAFPVGLTLCAADPNLLVLVYASGTVGDRIGHEASDAVVARVLAATLASAAGGSVPEAAAIVPAPTATPAPSIRPAAAATLPVLLVADDLYWEQDELTIPAEQDVTLLLENAGSAPHNFSIDELGISVDLAPGSRQEIVINIPAGDYEFYCNVPGHLEAGMVGTLIAGAGFTSSTPGDADTRRVSRVVEHRPASAEWVVAVGRATDGDRVGARERRRCADEQRARRAAAAAGEGCKRGTCVPAHRNPGRPLR